MPDFETITSEAAIELIDRQESHFWDHKSRASGGATIQKIAAALANADGGEFIVGVEDRRAGSGLARWRGFGAIEDGNFIQQSLVNDIEPPVPYAIQWFSIEEEDHRGLAVLVSITKSTSVHRTSASQVWVRRGAQSLELTGQRIVDLTLSKGALSYEDQFLDRYRIDDLVEEPELNRFLEAYSPKTAPATFATRQRLVNRDTNEASVAAAVLYAESPPAVIPKKCSVKVARYTTSEPQPRREHLSGVPVTIEGPAQHLIQETLSVVTKMVEAVKILEPDGTMAPARYPPEALKEIIVNAVIHRDYNLSDDILVFVFDNRVEVRSPGVLPGHMTLDNLLSDRFARNPTVVRLLNKYPDPPNKDIGEGLDTVLGAMAKAKLQAPEFAVEKSAFVVYLGHTPLARPEEIVLEYLESHDEITNAIARGLCAIPSENAMKRVFLGLARAGKIERVPGRGGGSAAWRVTRSN